MQTNAVTRNWRGAEASVLILGEDRITCLANGAPEETSVPLLLPPKGADPTAALVLAVEEVRGALPESRARRQVRVVLLPPLSEGKLLHNLPPLRREETEQVIRTTAAQHFLRGGVPLVVGVEEEISSEDASDDDATPPRPPVLAAAAPRALADAIHRAVTSVGWEIDSIIPAHAAWLAALRSWGEGAAASGGGTGSPRVLVALTGGTAHLLRIEGEGLTRVRRFPASALREILEGAGDGPGRILLSAEGSAGQAILDAFTEAGWHAAKESRLAGGPAALAGQFAGETELEMVPPRLAMERRDRVRRVGIRLGIAGGVLFLATAVVLLLGARMELRSVREYREEIRSSVAPLLAGADSLFRMEDQLRAIEEVEADSEGWAFVLVELAVLLPEDTHLERMQAAGDTLVIEAVGGRAGEVLEALRSSSTLIDPRLEGTIQRDVEGGETTRERFRLSAIRVEGPPSSLPQPAEGDL
jgi:hypothetical protein